MKNIILGLLCLLLINLYACNFMQSSSDLIPVMMSDNQRYGYINNKGETEIPARFSRASAFRDGLARVREGDGYGYIDKKGEYVVLPKFQEATVFNEGVAWVVAANGAPVLIDTKGKELLTLRKAEVVTVFSDGLALVENEDSKIYVDQKGKTVISGDFEEADLFRYGLAAVKKGEKWGFIDKTGKMAIAYQFDVVDRFAKDGLCIVQVGDRWGAINTKGEYMINPVYSSMRNDKEGFVVKQEGALYGYTDRKGKMVIPPQFSYMQGFNGSSVAPVLIGEKWGFVNKTGKIVLSPQYDYIGEMERGIASFSISLGHGYGFLNKNGNIVINPQYKNVGYPHIEEEDNLMEHQREDLAVRSDYFNMDFVKNELIPLAGELSEKYIHKPIHDILKRFSAEASVLDVNRMANVISENRLTQGVTIRVDLGELPYTEISDGWWGTVRQFSPDYKLYNAAIILDCKGKAYGKTDAIAEAFNNAKNSDSRIQKNKAHVFVNASAKDSHTVFITLETNHLD